MTGTTSHSITMKASGYAARAPRWTARYVMIHVAWNARVSRSYCAISRRSRRSHHTRTKAARTRSAPSGSPSLRCMWLTSCESTAHTKFETVTRTSFSASTLRCFHFMPLSSCQTGGGKSVTDATTRHAVNFPRAALGCMGHITFFGTQLHSYAPQKSDAAV